MSQLPDEVYMPNKAKYSTLDFYTVYDEYAEEVEKEGIENFTMYIPEYRKEEAIRQVIDKACKWVETHTCVFKNIEEVELFKNLFKKAMEE